MKKKLSMVLLLALIMMIAGCGSSGFNGDGVKDTGMEINGFTDRSTDNVESYVTGGDYSSTYIDSNKADYSYAFKAGGDSKKTKSQMLEDYEYIQDFVTEKGGLIENVYNDYQYYDTKTDFVYETAKRYVSTGYLSYTIEIDNKYVQNVVDELEKMCKDNKFTVYQYTQKITNYELHSVVDSYDDDPNTTRDTITKEDLEQRLKYADITVRFDYNMPRGTIGKVGLSIKSAWNGFWNNAGNIIQGVIVIMIALFAVFGELILFYKMFRKMQYKHRKTKPQYYSPKEVKIVSESSIKTGSISKDS